MISSPLFWMFGLPLVAALAVLFVPAGRAAWVRAVALAGTGIPALIGLRLLAGFDAATVGAGGYRFVQKVPWVPSLGISLSLGVDGVNLGLLAMGAIVAFAAV
jgi:NADH-quinone oxidoreductase subunit M